MSNGNAAIILNALDEQLEAEVDLTLYGRAALQLGFSEPREEYAWSHDVDVVLWLGQAEELLQATNFWDAVNQVNQRFAEKGLYISHFFEEDQVVLLPDWRKNRVGISGKWRWLQLHRLGNMDLFLSKLMRDDPIDLADARFIRDRAGFSREELERAFENARIPDIPEIVEQFQHCSARFL